MRPDDVDTVYIPSIDLATLVEQIKKRSDSLKDAVENGLLTVTTQDPTQSQFGSLVLQTDPSFEISLKQLWMFMKDISRGLSKDVHDVTITGDGRVLVNVEEYVPSAFKTQTAHTVANLPQ